MKKLYYNRIALISVILFQLGPLGALFAQGNWVSYTTENTILVDNQINDILIIDNVKWIGTSWGLYTFDGIIWTDYSEHLPNPQVRSLTLDNNGVLYVGTLNGIAVFDGNIWSIISSERNAFTNQINDIVFDNQNVGYIGTIDGLYKIENDTISLVLDSSSLEPGFINVRSLTFKGDSLCIGTINGGLGYLYNDSVMWYNSNSGLLDNSVTDLLVSGENLWITAPFGGLITHLSTGSFITFNTGFFDDWPSNSLECIIEHDELFYIGSNEGGMFSFSYENGIQNTTVYNTQNSGLIDNVVLCIEKGDNGLWIGTKGGLVYWGETSEIESIKPSSLYSFDGKIFSFEKPSDVVVFSVDGKKIIEKYNANTINMSTYSTGIYVLSIDGERIIHYKN